MRALVLVIVLVGVANAAPPTVTHAVAITGMKFVPAELDVKVGDVIVWTNEDLVPHTVTADDGSFDSRKIAPKATWKLTVKKAGKIPYTCTFHPGMTGTLSASAH